MNRTRSHYSYSVVTAPNYQNLLPVTIGSAAFFLICGPWVLLPSNIAWLEGGDSTQHFLGWHFFRYSPWSFPVGANPSFGLELSNGIIFSDSNPLLAFLFKPLSSLLPQVFQYTGIWLLLCFVMQAWFGWKLTELASKNLLFRCFGAGLFAFSPPMILRLSGHYSLGAHFVVLAALYMTLVPSVNRRHLAWGALLGISSLMHAYLLAMVGLLWLSDLANRLLRKEIPTRSAALEFGLTILLVSFTCWQAGYFSVDNAGNLGGYGYYRLNLLSVIDPSGWSYVIRDLPEAKGDYEGFNYVGLGVIFLIFVNLPKISGANVSFIFQTLKRLPFLYLALAALFVFALTHEIGIGSLNFKLKVPHEFTEIASIFRSSGRMFWPVFYIIVFSAIFLTARGYTKKWSAPLLGLALAIQIIDTSAAWTGIRNKLMVSPSSSWEMGLVDPFWQQAAQKYTKVRWLLPENRSPAWDRLSAYAGHHNMATDAIYLARVSGTELKDARRKALTALRTGRYEPQTLYVLDDKLLGQAAQSLNTDQDLLAKIDNLNVIAPGWKKCHDCALVASELRPDGVLNYLKTGDALYFGKDGTGIGYLSDGWSDSEEWGTWSASRKSEMLLPLSGEIKLLTFEANALVTPEHPRQAVDIEINDTLVARTVLTAPTGNTVSVTIPDNIRALYSNRATLTVKFLLPDATRPRDIGLNKDTRMLAIGLKKLSLD